MNIQHFAARCGLSAHTLRYYEKLGLLRHVRRDSSGHRRFADADLSWVEFIKRLKDTGMPLEQIQRYADLREQGDASHAQRLQLLQAHAAALQARIALEAEHLDKLQEKIEHYRRLTANVTEA